MEFRVLDSEGDRGLSDCQAEALLDIDFIDPKAPLFRSPRFLPTLFHELFHIQQGVLCETLTRDIIEGTAQVVSWTVLAAVAIRERSNSLGREAAYALVLELRKVALNIAFLEMLRNPSSQKAFMELLWKVYGFSAQAILAKAMKEYNENPKKSLRLRGMLSEK